MLRRKLASYSTAMALILGIFSLAAFAAPMAAQAAPDWNLVWSDEFNGNSLNTANWTAEIGTGSGGWGNNELEYYTDRQENLAVTGGNLVITARNEAYGGMNYTSARIKTQGKKSFTYGKIEASIKLPTGQGLWPAFWTLGESIAGEGWPACGEIDIMERVNFDDHSNGYIHWWADGQADYGTVSGYIDFSQFHTYSIEWDANAIKWFVDGVQFLEANIKNGVNGTEEFHRPQFLLLNLAVGGQWPGNPNGSTPFPAQMLVDYVRVYQDGGTVITDPENPDPEPSPFATPNLAPGKAIFASSLETPEFPATLANDVNAETRWSSALSDNQWIYVDLGKDYMVNGARLLWEDAYATNYRIDVATANPQSEASWNTVYSNANGHGGTESIPIDAVPARYVRMYGISRATQYGFSLYEFEVYGGEIFNVPATFNATKWTAKSPEIENDTLNGKDFVGYLIDGSYLDYYINVPQAGAYNITLNASVGLAGERNVALYSGTTQVGTLPIAVNGSDWFNFQPNSGSFTLPAGLQKLRLVVNNSVNIENITIEPAIVLPPEPDSLTVTSSANELQIHINTSAPAGSRFWCYVLKDGKVQYNSGSWSTGKDYSPALTQAENYQVRVYRLDANGTMTVITNQ
ncbi:MAG: family 16 glycosylhydrolase [Oscillospiraceae bacterium]|jgi:beta-glucanase (GH16 family)|nr:family 16 glycosylhydrolase [Oscillospiraceae bacterium]